MLNDTLKKQWEFQKDKDLYPGATKSVSNMVKTMSVNNPVNDKTSTEVFIHFINNCTLKVQILGG